MTDRKRSLLTFVGVWAGAYTVGNVIAGFSVIAPPQDVFMTVLVFPSSGVLFLAEHASFDLPGWTGFLGHILQLAMFVAAFFVKTKKAYTITTAINAVLAVSCVIGYKDTIENFFTAMYF